MVLPGMKIKVKSTLTGLNKGLKVVSLEMRDAVTNSVLMKATGVQCASNAYTHAFFT